MTLRERAVETFVDVVLDPKWWIFTFVLVFGSAAASSVDPSVAFFAGAVFSALFFSGGD